MAAFYLLAVLYTREGVGDGATGRNVLTVTMRRNVWFHFSFSCSSSSHSLHLPPLGSNKESQLSSPTCFSLT